MTSYLLSHETSLRFGMFLGMFAAIGLWEVWAPRRRTTVPRIARWPGNIGMVVLNTLLVRLLFPVAALGVALVADRHGWGLFRLLDASAPTAFLGSLVLLDFAVYLQHHLFHAVPVLWRLHRMHHADIEFDVTTGSRFHPLEIGLSMAIKMAVVVALGAPAPAVLVFEMVLNATAMFNHGNIALAPQLDRILRWFIVTPDMHRVHHSVKAHELNSNFGFNLPWWDRLCATYRAVPEGGHAAMRIGLEDFRDPHERRLDRLLTQPFRQAGGVR